jgi:hypothetical protein
MIIGQTTKQLYGLAHNTHTNQIQNRGDGKKKKKVLKVIVQHWMMKK